MIKDDCALWVDCQPDTSALTDFNHLVLLLKDDGDACVFAHIWQLKGFQSRKTEADEPMMEETWSMEGTNPTAYKAEWAPLQGAAAIEVVPLKGMSGAIPTTATTRKSRLPKGRTTRSTMKNKTKMTSS